MGGYAGIAIGEGYLVTLRMCGASTRDVAARVRARAFRLARKAVLRRIISWYPYPDPQKPLSPKAAFQIFRNVKSQYPEASCDSTSETRVAATADAGCEVDALETHAIVTHSAWKGSKGY